MASFPSTAYPAQLRQSNITRKRLSRTVGKISALPLQVHPERRFRIYRAYRVSGLGFKGFKLDSQPLTVWFGFFLVWGVGLLA